MLSAQAIEDYKKIFKDEFGKDISYNMAEEQGTRLIKLFEILLQIERRIRKRTESESKI